MIQVVQIIALPLSLFCPALQQFSPQPAYPSDSKHNDSPSLPLRRNCLAMIWHSPCRVTGVAIMNVPIGRAGTPARYHLLSVRGLIMCAPHPHGAGLASCTALQSTGSEGHCAKTCQSRLYRRHTSGQDQPGGQHPLAYAATNALTHRINRNVRHAREAPADTKRHLSHHHGVRAVVLLIKEPWARLRSLPRQSRFSALSYPPATPPTD